MLGLVSYYKENASILRKTFKDMGFSVYGGQNAPYVWVGFPGQASWDAFADILTKCNIVTTPGSGFGPAGEGFVRASAFGHRSVSCILLTDSWYVDHFDVYAVPCHAMSCFSLLPTQALAVGSSHRERC